MLFDQVDWPKSVVGKKQLGLRGPVRLYSHTFERCRIAPAALSNGDIPILFLETSDLASIRCMRTLHQTVHTCGIALMLLHRWPLPAFAC